MKKHKGAFILLLLFFSLCVTSIFSKANPVFAYRPPEHEVLDGNKATGLIFKNEPLIDLVSSEFQFDIQDFPKTEEVTFENYNANVKMSYQFKNPKNEAMDVDLGILMEKVPKYFEMENRFSDLNRYEVMVDNQQANGKIRYTYSNFNYSFSDLMNEYKEHEYFNSNLSVVKRTYRFENVESGGVIALRVHRSAMIYSRICYDDSLPFKTSYTDNDYYFFYRNEVEEEQENTPLTFDFYFLGYNAYQFDLYFDYYETFSDIEENVPSSPDKIIASCESEEMEFEDFVYMFYKSDNELGISQIDWYNAVIDLLVYKNNYQKIISYEEMKLDDFLNRFYEYSLHLEPNQVVSTSITMPLYPDVDLDYSPYLYKYRAYLFPNWSLNTFKNVTISVKTPFYLYNDSGLFESKKKNNEYVKHYSMFQDKYFNFELATSSSFPENLLPGTFGKEIRLVLGIFLGFLLLATSMITAPLINSHIRRKYKYYEIVPPSALRIIYYCFAFIFASLTMINHSLSLLFYILIFDMMIAMIYMLSSDVEMKSKVSNRTRKEQRKGHRFALLRLLLTIFTCIGIFISMLKGWYDIKEYPLVALILSIYVIIFFVFELIMIIIDLIYATKYNQKVNKQQIMPQRNRLTNHPKKSLPYGFISNTQYWIARGIIVAFTVVFIYVIKNAIEMSDNNRLCVLIAFVVLSFAIYYGTKYFDLMMFAQYNKNLDFIKLKEKIITRVNNPSVNPNYKAHLLVKLAQIAMLLDKEEFMNIMSMIHTPKNNNDEIMYNELLLNIYLEYETFEANYGELTQLYQDNQMMSQALFNHKNKMLLYYGQTINWTINIDNVCSLNKGNRCKKALNLFIQTYYYYKQNKLDKAKEYKNMFIAKYGYFKECVKMLEQDIIV